MAMMFAVALVVAVGMVVPAAASAVTSKPGAPTGVTALPQDQGAVVSWTPPSSDGGSPVTGYVITASPGGLKVHTSAVTSFLVGGLTNGTAYTFTVAAVNASGKGPASSPSAAVTPEAPVVPGAARSMAAVAGFEQATVSWAAPKSDGGAPVTSYTISTRPATTVTSVDGSARSAVAAGLADGTSYRVLVAAVNSVGAGRAVASAPVTPQVTVPGAPAGVTAAPAGSGVKVGWQPPASDGGSAVSGYVVTVAGTSTTVTAAATARSVTITGLTAGTSYTFTVAAANAQGTGPAAASTPATAGATEAAHTVVLSKASLATLTQVGTDGSLVFTSPTTQVQHVAVGDVVAAGVSAATPGGLLAQVTSVTPAGSSLTVATTPASLDQALSAGGFGASAALTSGQVASFTPARRGVRLVPANAVPVSAAPGSIGVSVNVDLYNDDHGEHVVVQGSLAVTPQMSFSASISCCVHVASHFTGTVTAAESLSLSAQLSHDIAGGFTLGTITFTPITIDVAGVPIVIIPTLTIQLIANGTVSIGTVTAGSVLTAGADVSTSDATVTATPIFHETTTYTPPTVDEPFSAAIGPKAELSTVVDGLAGPSLTDSLSLPKLTVDPLHSPWWALTAENELDLGYKLDLLNQNFANYQKTLLHNTYTIAQAQDPYQQVIITPSPAAVAPGGRLQLHAQVAGVNSQNVTWAAQAGGGTVTAGGLYTAPTTPGTYAVTAAQPASGLKPAATGIIGIRVGHQPPGPPTGPTAASTSYGTATITWQPPADTGGGTITGYTITASPGGQAQTVSGTATTGTMAGLTPGAPYTFAISATSDGGTSLPSPATAPIVIDNVNGGGNGWAAARAPLPGDSSTPPSAGLNSVACSSASACTAVGEYGTTSSPGGLIDTGSGMSWTGTAAPASPPAGTGLYLQAVACPSASSCTAVGGYVSSSFDEPPVMASGSGTSWTTTVASLPANAAAVPYSYLSSLACPSTSSCTAVGTYNDTSGNDQGLLLTGSGTSWTPTEAPLPAGAGSPAYPNLTSVACTPSGQCVAVGTYTDKSGSDQGLLLTGSGTSWTATKAPLPSNADATSGSGLSAVACPAAAPCTAVGQYTDKSGNSQVLLLTGSGASWTATEAPLPANARAGSASSDSIACPSTTSCAAAGYYIDPSNDYHLLMLTGSGASWTATGVPLPPGAAVQDEPDISAIGCSTAPLCTVAGDYADSSGNEQGLLVTGSATSWTAGEAPLPADASPTGQSVYLPGVTCSSPGPCTVVGSYGDTSGGTEGLLLTGPGT